MPRLPSGTLTGLVALAMLSLLPGSAGAQERTMRFRPVPPESAAVHDDRQNVTITKVRHGETTSVDFRVPAVPNVPEVPEIPEVPKEPRARSTTGDLVRFGSDVTVDEDQAEDRKSVV